MEVWTDGKALLTRGRATSTNLGKTDEVLQLSKNSPGQPRAKATREKKLCLTSIKRRKEIVNTFR